MKGYYTVSLVGEGFSKTECIVLETRFAALLEAHLGGRDCTTNLVLHAAENLDSRSELHAACRCVEAILGADGAQGRFALRAWSAIDI